MDLHHVAGKSANELGQSTLDQGGAPPEPNGNELSNLLAEADRREAETKAKNARQYEAANQRRGLLDALADVQALVVPSSDEEIVAEWASLWLQLAEQLRVNRCEQLVDLVKSPDIPEYEVARSVLRRALAGDSQQQLTRLFLDMGSKPDGGYRSLNLVSFLSLLRDAIEQHWLQQIAPVATASQDEAAQTKPALATATSAGAPRPHAGSIDRTNEAIELRTRDPRKTQIVFKALQAVRALQVDWIDGAQLEKLGISPSTLHHVSTKHWAKGQDYKGTESKRRQYGRSRLIKYVEGEWTPRLPKAPNPEAQ